MTLKPSSVRSRKIFGDIYKETYQWIFYAFMLTVFLIFQLEIQWIQICVVNGEISDALDIQKRSKPFFAREKYFVNYNQISKFPNVLRTNSEFPNWRGFEIWQPIKLQTIDIFMRMVIFQWLAICHPLFLRKYYNCSSIYLPVDNLFTAKLLFKRNNRLVD